MIKILKCGEVSNDEIFARVVPTVDVAGIVADIIHLNGSIEIAPILGLSDVIVDIVETGTTLKENDLEVMDTIVPISARLIANTSSFKFKNEAIEKLLNEMKRLER